MTVEQILQEIALMAAPTRAFIMGIEFHPEAVSEPPHLPLTQTVVRKYASGKSTGENAYE